MNGIDEDPVRKRVLDALERRAQAQPPGTLRDKLMARLLQRSANAPSAAAPRPAEATRPAARPLVELLALLQADAGTELRQFRAHQGTWRQLRVARSMAELDAPPAGSLGPLNGQALATRALQQIQTLAPDYLHRLLTQIDALAALERVQPSGDAERPARAGRKKDSANGRR